MRFSNILIVMALLGSTMAAPVLQKHHHHRNKRDIIVTPTILHQVTVLVATPHSTGKSVFLD